MRQPEQQLHPAQDDDLDDGYAACLTEDVQLFGQQLSTNNLLMPSIPISSYEQLNGDLEKQAEIESTTITKPPKAKRATKRASASNVCDVCNRCLGDAYSLRIHKMTHTDERPHVCSLCGKGFRQLNKLRIHAVTHTKERPHACDICGKGYRFANYLTVHRRLHTGEKPYACTWSNCSMSFHSVHARRMHTKLQHASKDVNKEEEQEQEQQQVETSSLSYTCPICARILTDQCYLNTHLKRHFNQRDYACLQDGCGKRFFSSSELNHHQIAHTRHRTFRCPLCSSCFLRNSNYKQHYLKVHNGGGN